MSAPNPFVPKPIQKQPKPDEGFLPPCAIEAEEALLGGLFSGGKLSVCLSEGLTPEDFFKVQHGWIYAAMCDVDPEPGATDAERNSLTLIGLDAVAALLADRHQLDQLMIHGEGGVMALRWLIAYRGGDMFPAVRGLARTIREKAISRRALNEFSRCATEFFNDDIDPTILIDRHVRVMEQLKPFRINAEFVRGRLSTNTHESMLAEQAKRQSWHTVPWTALGERVPVTVDGDLIVVAGPEGSGKSSMLMNWAEYEANQGNQTAYIHTEMTKADVFNRRLVAHTKVIPFAALQKPEDLNDPQWAHIVEVGVVMETWLPRLDYWHAGQPGEDKLFAVMQRMVDDFDTRCFVLDYLNDVIPEIKRRDTNSADTWRNLLARLEHFNNRNGTRIITGAQINKEGNAYMIGSALRHKATLFLKIKPKVLEHDFDFEFDGVPYRYFAGDRSPLMTLAIEKHRGGGGGVLKMLYVGPRFLWADVPAGFDDGSTDPGAYVGRGAKD